jgi:hypothetical protein
MLLNELFDYPSRLLEYAVNLDTATYGHWLNVATKEVVEVPFGSHYKVAVDIMERSSNKDMYFDAFDYMYWNHYVRIYNKRYDIDASLTLEGSKDDVKAAIKILNYLVKNCYNLVVDLVNLEDISNIRPDGKRYTISSGKSYKFSPVFDKQSFRNFLNESLLLEYTYPFPKLNIYGSWINSNTGEITPVPYQKHLAVIQDIMISLNDTADLAHAYTWAFKHEFVRLFHSRWEVQRSVGIEGTANALRKVLPSLMPLIRESVEIEIDVLDEKSKNTVGWIKATLPNDTKNLNQFIRSLS